MIKTAALALGLVLMAGSVAAKAPTDVVVFSSLHEKGYQPPTADKPAYFMALSGGYHIDGVETGLAKDDPSKITAEQVFAVLTKPLAAQNYLPATKQHPPTILLVAQWGYFRPNLKEPNDPTDENQSTGSQTFLNQSDANRAALLTGGNRAPLGTFAYEDARSRMADDRFFVVLSAYDYAASKKERKKVVLWRTRMSVVMNPTTLAESLEPMATAGGQFFGRDSELAREIDLTLKKGTVKLGETEVIELGTPDVKPDEKKKR
jgi:hypothetical protein